MRASHTLCQIGMLLLLVGPAARAGESTNTNACQSNIRALPYADGAVTMSGTGAPNPAIAGLDTIVLGSTSVRVELPSEAVVAGYDLGLLLAGPNTIPVDLELTLAGTNTAEAESTTSVSTSAQTIISDPDGMPGSGDESATPLDAWASIPGTAWRPLGGDVEFSQASLVVTVSVAGGLLVETQTCQPGQSAPDGSTFTPLDPTPFDTVNVLGEPEIEVNPTAVDFVDTDLGSTDMQMVTITNTGDAPLTLASVALAPGGDPAFALSLAPAPGTAVAPAASEDVEVTFTPTDGDLAAGTLVIASDDADEPSVSIPLTGHGVPYDEQAMDLLDFFDGADLQSTQGNRDHAMRNLLESAGDYLDRGQTRKACDALARALQRVDGIEPPDPPPVPDFVEGPDADALADEIRALRQNLGCDAPRSPRGGRCGIGFELALLMPPLWALRRRRASARS